MSLALRPIVNVYSINGVEIAGTISVPAVYNAPVRPDIVRFVHTKMLKNNCQPYAISDKAGEQTSAESWGTGHAVARIPRVIRSGTHRAGQAAFSNMVRGERMFRSAKVWRKWQFKTNVNHRRFATVSDLAASGIPSLVMSRGHLGRFIIWTEAAFSLLDDLF